MHNIKRKVFVRYHHGNNQWHANQLRIVTGKYEIFTDRSLDRRRKKNDLTPQEIQYQYKKYDVLIRDIKKNK